MAIILHSTNHQTQKPVLMLKIIIVIVLLTCTCTQVFSQSGGSTLDLEKLAGTKQTSNASSLSSEQEPVMGVIDPSVYYVGPGDVISYQTSGLDFTEKTTVVTPENTLLLERLGLINVDGLTLKELRDTISARVKQRSSAMDVYLTLRRPRLVYVTLKGDVPFPGTYAVPASMKIGTIVELSSEPWILRKDNIVVEQYRMNTPRSESLGNSSQKRSNANRVSPYAQRNITVKNREKIKYIDIAGSHSAGKEYLNPHVREGDEIVVPFEPTSYPSISISGAVLEPSILPYRKGDLASTLLKAAGGALPDADIERVVLIQPNSNEKIPLKVTESLDIIGSDPELLPGSTIVVEHVVYSGANSQGVVEINGEVYKPGAVVIQQGVTTLSSVIARAGGLKPGASTNLAYIVRPEPHTNNREIRELSNRKFMYSDLKLEDTTRYILDQTLRVPYVSCNITQALADTTSAQNIALQSGDIIVIPPIPTRVYVYGQVQQAGYVTYAPNKTLHWYVEKAGGYAQGARKDRARIIRGKSNVWVEDIDNNVVEPGDEVYVPRSPDVPVGTELQTYAILAGIISSVVAITATMISILSR